MPAALACLALAAVAAPADPALGPARPGEKALTFARQLVAVADNVTHQYVRPVDVADLLEPALTALAASARRPLPAGFKPDLRRAADAFRRGSAEQLVYLVARCRDRLGEGEALAEPRAMLTALTALGAALDPYCGPVPSAAFVGRGDDPPFGVGLELAGPPGGAAAGPAVPGAGPWAVAHVVPGSPAQAAGLRPGDLIVAVDGKPAHDPAALAGLARLMQFSTAEPQPSFTTGLTVRRGTPPKERAVEVRAEPYTSESVWGVRRRADQSWDYWADPARKLAHVRVGPIGRAPPPRPSTPEQFLAALQALKADGARGLLLDLRWNPGGYLDKSAEVAQLVLREGEVARVVNRGGTVTDLYASDAPDAEFSDLPLVVLVNRETTGGGELIAAALQDNKRAVVVGERTVGKVSVQKFLDQPVPLSGYGFKYTSGFFLRPSLRSLPTGGAAAWAVRPDPGCELPVSPELSARLKAWWTLQTLRPAGDREPLPLDDPDADPQRQAALAILAARAAK